ncbi:MAG: DNA polymerase III subunit delta' [Hydrogenothermaceae bacterium]|nr:DNA polymerase III subunit delta' [Hydrogenothermaceae bacterium]
MKLIGHEREKVLVRRLLEKGYDSLSLLFEGVNCIGKKMLALYAARAYLCDKREGFGCGECKDCRLIDNTIMNVYEKSNLTPHHDLMLIQSDNSEIKIDQIREIGEFLKLKGDKGKVVIVEKAENMNTESSNAFLKTLEEPPEGTLIILTTSNQAKLIPTILSRLKKVKFRKLGQEEVESILLLKGIQEKKAKMLSEMADGSMCLPVYFLENEVIYNYSKDLYRLILNPEHREGLLSLSSNLENLQPQQIIKVFDIIYTLLGKDVASGKVRTELFEKFIREYEILIKAISNGVKKKLVIEGFFLRLIQ